MVEELVNEFVLKMKINFVNVYVVIKESLDKEIEDECCKVRIV